jgi:hypothetical protein
MNFKYTSIQNILFFLSLLKQLLIVLDKAIDDLEVIKRVILKMKHLIILVFFH